MTYWWSLLRPQKNGEMIFAKNSDRDPNEAQVLDFVPRQSHLESTVKLTYVELPQVEESYATLFSRPWWMWGAEMGANERGLVVGNTAVFTKEPYEEIGILGMDMVRLALERAENSREALSLLTSMVERYGQGGSGSWEHKLLYHNSFVIADPKEAYALETAGRRWVAKRIKGVYSISNALVIENDWDFSSKDVLERAAGASSRGLKFSFASFYSDRFYTHFARGRERRSFTYRKLKEREGDVNLTYVMEILRSHFREPYAPQDGSMRDICMHYGGLTRPSQTASSQISVLTQEYKIHWFTGTSLPCLSLFKPFQLEDSLPGFGERPTNKYDPKSYWWRFEKFHRVFQTNYRKYIGAFSRDRDELQNKIVEETTKVLRSRSGERFLGVLGDVVWLTPYAPMSTYEVWAISKSFSSILDTDVDGLSGFAEGIANVLKFFEDEGLSCFNLVLYSGPLGEDSSEYFRLGLRLIGRAGYKPPYVSDLWGLQALLQEGESYEAPESMARKIRPYFHR